MQSTGVYWIAVYEILEEAGLEGMCGLLVAINLLDDVAPIIEVVGGAERAGLLDSSAGGIGEGIAVCVVRGECGHSSRGRMRSAVHFCTRFS